MSISLICLISVPFLEHRFYGLDGFTRIKITVLIGVICLISVPFLEHGFYGLDGFARIENISVHQCNLFDQCSFFRTQILRIGRICADKKYQC